MIVRNKPNKWWVFLFRCESLWMCFACVWSTIENNNPNEMHTRKRRQIHVQNRENKMQQNPLEYELTKERANFSIDDAFVVVALDLEAWYWCPCSLQWWILPVPVRARRLHFVAPNRLHRFHAFDSPYCTGQARLEQNQNRCPFGAFLDSHHAPAPSIRAVLHLAMCKFVIHLMAHYHVETPAANDDDPSNRIHATATDTSSIGKKHWN